MLELLEACVRLDTLASRLYGTFADATTDPELRDVFLQLQSEENEHLGWWGDALERVQAGELSSFGNGAEITAYMNAILEAVSIMADADPYKITDDERLALAASIEFFALDPIFAWLISVSHATLGSQRRVIYSGHVGLLVSTMEQRGSWSLAPHIARLRASSESAQVPRGRAGSGPEGILPPRSVAVHALDELCSDAARDREWIALGILEVPVDRLKRHGESLTRSAIGKVVSVLVSLVRFSDLLVSLEDGRFAVVFPSTGMAGARGLMMSLSEAASGVVEAATGGHEVAHARVAIVTLPPGDHRGGGEATFEVAENLAREAASEGRQFAMIELA
jgi:hypothetical protein